MSRGWRRRSAGSCWRSGAARWKLLVALLEPGVEVRIVTWGDHRVGELTVEEPQLLQGAAQVVGVVGARRSGFGAVELALDVEGVAADHEVALGEPRDHRHVAGAVAGGIGEVDGVVPEEVEGAAEAGVGVDAGAVEVEAAVV